MNKNVYSVSQVNKYVEGLIKDDYMLKNLSISGEVSNCKYNHTGHIYFTLKDETSSISCVMFAGNKIQGLKFKMKDGDKVVVNGYVGVYAVTGQYQVYARSIELAGLGDLYLRFEKLKQELEESGMFDDMYKQPLPKYAKRIGIVTAPTGAAVHDIIRVSKSRNPFVELILFPAQVQGEAAAPSIVQGINLLDSLDLDVIIVGRGGGSIEDLWAFNEEIVARAIFNAKTPIISAVGHETDFTIADFVADKRAATPSQAAEFANFRYDEFSATLERYHDRINMSMDQSLSSRLNRLELYKRQLDGLSPESKLKQEMERLNNMHRRLDSAINVTVDRFSNRLAVLAERIDGMSPAKKISEGFGYLVDKNNNRIDSVEKVSVGDDITINITDGTIKGRVTSVEAGK